MSAARTGSVEGRVQAPARAAVANVLADIVAFLLLLEAGCLHRSAHCSVLSQVLFACFDALGRVRKRARTWRGKFDADQFGPSIHELSVPRCSTLHGMGFA